MQPAPRWPLVVTGVAMVVLPLVAAWIRIEAFGMWLLHLGVAMLAVGLPIYVFNISIVSLAMFSRDGAFARSAGRRRAVTAAWISLALMFVTAITAVDEGRPSLLQRALGIGWTGDGAAELLLLSIVCTVVWLTAWLWFVLEWIVVLEAVRRRRKPAPDRRAVAVPRPGPGTVVWMPLTTGRRSPNDPARAPRLPYGVPIPPRRPSRD